MHGVTRGVDNTGVLSSYCNESPIHMGRPVLRPGAVGSPIAPWLMDTSSYDSMDSPGSPCSPRIIRSPNYYRSTAVELLYDEKTPQRGSPLDLTPRRAESLTQIPQFRSSRSSVELSSTYRAMTPSRWVGAKRPCQAPQEAPDAQSHSISGGYSTGVNRSLATPVKAPAGSGDGQLHMAEGPHLPTPQYDGFGGSSSPSYRSDLPCSPYSEVPQAYQHPARSAGEGRGLVVSRDRSPISPLARVRSPLGYSAVYAHCASLIVSDPNRSDADGAGGVGHGSTGTRVVVGRALPNGEQGCRGSDEVLHDNNSAIHSRYSGSDHNCGLVSSHDLRSRFTEASTSKSTTATTLTHAHECRIHRQYQTLTRFSAQSESQPPVAASSPVHQRNLSASLRSQLTSTAHAVVCDGQSFHTLPSAAARAGVRESTLSPVLVTNDAEAPARMQMHLYNQPPQAPPMQAQQQQQQHIAYLNSPPSNGLMLSQQQLQAKFTASVQNVPTQHPTIPSAPKIILHNGAAKTSSSMTSPTLYHPPVTSPVHRKPCEMHTTYGPSELSVPPRLSNGSQRKAESCTVDGEHSLAASANGGYPTTVPILSDSVLSIRTVGSIHDTHGVQSPENCTSYCGTPLTSSPVNGGVTRHLSGGGGKLHDASIRSTASGASVSVGGAECRRVLELAPGSPSPPPLSMCFTSSAELLRKYTSRWVNKHEESKYAYNEGGYMQVTPGRPFNNRYIMIQKLGWGEFSTVWLAYDARFSQCPEQSANGRVLSAVPPPTSAALGVMDRVPELKQHQAFVAVKIAKCHRAIAESTQYEINLLRLIRERSPPEAPLTNLIDNFECKGPYGSHVCMVMPLHGSNLLCLLDQVSARNRFRGPGELLLIKEIVASILEGLTQLEKINVIHTDLKPENVLCTSPDPRVLRAIDRFCERNKDKMPAGVQDFMAGGDPNHLVCLADFGLSALLEPQETSEAARKVGTKSGFPVSRSGEMPNPNGVTIQTREYRAPEVIFGMEFSCRTDIWSLGCLVFELISGEFLMDPKRRASGEREIDIEHVAMMIQLLGPVPSSITRLVNRSRPPRYLSRYFNSSGKFVYSDKYRHYRPRNLTKELEVYLGKSGEAALAAQFILSCLTYELSHRASAAELLCHPWLKNVGRVSSNRSDSYAPYMA